MYRESALYPSIKWLIIGTTVMWILQIVPMVGESITAYLSLIPTLAGHGQIWRFVTYGFLHDPHSVFHILFNLLGLWMFGSAVIDRWGERKFLIFYLSAILFSGLFSLIYLPFGQSPMIIGASGGILAIMTLYALFYPDQELLLFGVVPMKAWVTAVLYTVLSVGGFMTSSGGIAHLTHLGGILFAFLWLQYEKFQPRFSLPVVKKRKEPVIHYFEPRKSRQETVQEKKSVDDVLKKISDSGMSSLTEEEYHILEKASGKPVDRK